MFDLSQFEKAPVFAPDNQIGIVLSLPLASIIAEPQGDPLRFFFVIAERESYS